MTNTTWRQAAFATGPLCMTAYGLIRLTDPGHGPGPAWSLGHLALLSGVLLFAPVMLGLRRTAVATGRGRGSRTFADAGATLGLLGVAAVTAQASIDLLVGYASVDRDTMNVLFDHIRDLPGVTPAVYTIGPLLFYVGLLLLTVQLAALRAIVFWRPLAIVAGVAVSAISLDLIPVGGLLFLLALAPLGGNVPTQPVLSSVTSGISRPIREAHSLRSAKAGSTAP
ncbi:MULTISPECIES: hypothetical protein [Streptomyces]|uniref:DUF4386 family protein n=2 Tax=Streptomyces TaxID=1883 RepID=A0A3S9PHS0_STRLT|nr:hypothetical protein [Streptomyces luteoverticillatus]AZQ71918.1 hypothetical protein EKH77_12485 [Streptomyces luteoverticillatus]